MDNTTNMDANVLKNFGGVEANSLSNIILNDDDDNLYFSRDLHSSYIDTETLINTLHSKVGKFTILNLNVQSLTAKLHELAALVQELEDKNIHFSVICIQETLLLKNADTSLIQLPNYNFVHEPCRISQHSGVGCYIHKQFNFKIHELNILSDVWEGMFLDINGNDLSKTVTLGIVYRPGRNNINRMLDTFIN